MATPSLSQMDRDILDQLLIHMAPDDETKQQITDAYIKTVKKDSFAEINQYSQTLSPEERTFFDLNTSKQIFAQSRKQETNPELNSLLKSAVSGLDRLQKTIKLPAPRKKYLNFKSKKFLKNLRATQHLFANMTEEQLSSKAHYLELQEELIQEEEKAEKTIQKTQKSKRKRNKKKKKRRKHQKSFSLKPTETPSTKRFTLQPIKPAKDFFSKLLKELNQVANDHNPLAKRVKKWGDLSPVAIRQIPGYESNSDEENLDLQARHYLRGIQAVFFNQFLHEHYTFPTCYDDGEGNTLSGRGLLATLVFRNKVWNGAVYLGYDETTKKIYHAFLEQTLTFNDQRTIDDWLRPKLYAHFHKAKQESMENDGDWNLAARTTFHLERSQSKTPTLKMIQASSSGKEQLYYLFHPIRG